MQVSPRLPAGLRRTTETAPSLTLGAGETEATVTVPLHADVAGEFTLPAPTVSLTDTFELYTEQLSRGPQPKLTVLPQTPTVHIGKGGKPYGNAFGEHSTDQPGPGIATRDLRQYIVGEDAMNIDWKSTARLGEPYVRETEGETDRHTALLVDHRAHTGESATEETPLEYIREAALAMTASAVGHSDPLSLWTVGDDGLTETLAAGSTPRRTPAFARHYWGLPQRRRRQTIGRHQLAGYRRLSSHWTSRHRLDKRYNGTERGDGRQIGP